MAVTRFHEVTFHQVQTSDATQTTCGVVTLPDECYAQFLVRVVARTTGGVRAEYVRWYSAGREAGAGAAAVAGNTSTRLVEDIAAWDCLMDVSGNDMRVRVTGAAATTIDWLVMIDTLMILNP